MSKLKALREVANNIVSQSEELNKKEGLREFINSSNDYVLMSMIMGKKTPKSNLTETEKKKIESEFKVFLKEGIVGSILGMVIFSPKLWGLWRVAKASFSKAQRKCGAFRISQKRDLCLAQVKLDFHDKKIDILKKAMIDAKKKLPKEKADKVIKKATDKLAQLQLQRKDLERSVSREKEQVSFSL